MLRPSTDAPQEGLWSFRRLISFTTLLLLMASTTVLARAQSNFATQFGIRKGQAAPAQFGNQHPQDDQKALPLRFGKPVSYDSGGPYAVSVAVGDLNGDGKLDLVVADECQTTDYGFCDAEGEVAVLLGNGDGTFQPAVGYSTGADFANAIVLADLRGHGVLDIVAANVCQALAGGGCSNEVGAVGIMLGNGDGTFQPAAIYNTGALFLNSVAVGSLRGNGKLDIVAANGRWNGGISGGAAGVLLGNGDGTFQPVVNYDSAGVTADSVAIADLNGDGKPDVAVADFAYHATNDGAVGVLLGNGDGTLQPAVRYDSGGGGAYSVAVGDLRGNGIPDLVVANWHSTTEPKPNTVSVLLGNGDGTFQSAVSYSGAGAGIDSVAIGDMNGDGIPDLVLIDECQHYSIQRGCLGTGEVSVLLGNGDGTFQSPVKYGSGGYEGSSIAIADVNGDGRPDIIVTNACGNAGVGCAGPDGSVAVLLNETSYTSKTALVSSPNPSHVNQSVTFTAAVNSTPPVPNGEVVSFYNGKAMLGTGTTTNGVAVLTTSFPAAGKYTIKASYPGDPFRKPSSARVKQTVNP